MYSSTEQADSMPPMSKLSISTTSKTTHRKGNTKAQEPVADSWDDEDLSSDDDSDENGNGPSTPKNTDTDADTPIQPTSGTAAPPPTPISPRTGSASTSHSGWTPSSDYDYALSPTSSPAGEAESDERRRPEKTDAVARRMIAAGLGLKAPKQTEEQKAYQKSIREQEKKRREQERENEKRRREEADKAKAAVWDD